MELHLEERELSREKQREKNAGPSPKSREAESWRRKRPPHPSVQSRGPRGNLQGGRARFLPSSTNTSCVQAPVSLHSSQAGGGWGGGWGGEQIVA